MPTIEVNAPRIKVEQIPERPTHFYLTETVSSTAAADGERLEIMRTPSPFIFIIRGQKNEAEINLEPFFQEALLHVLRGNDYSPKEEIHTNNPACEHTWELDDDPVYQLYWCKKCGGYKDDGNG